MVEGVRVAIGRRRILRILRRLRIANMRTLEQKISDAGPPEQRVDPHCLLTARRELEQAGLVVREGTLRNPWYRLSATPEWEWKEQLGRLKPILRKLHTKKNSLLIGQVLEIAVFRALCSEQTRHGMEFIGGYPDLDPSDETTWKKNEPGMISGQSLSGGKKLDFALIHPVAGRVGVEVKNTREWFYPDKDRMLGLLAKCCELDAVPVLICRRYAYVTYSVLHRCGVLLFQNYNQLLPESMREVAEQAKHKDLLGYHDIRVGTDPDPRLRRFIGSQLPNLLPGARKKFEQYKDLLCDFANQAMSYEEFTARSRRREQGLPEDFDHDAEYEGEAPSW